MAPKPLKSKEPIEHLKEISSWISSIQDLDRLLEQILQSASRMMQAKASSLLLLDQETRKLYFKVATGEKKDELKAFKLDIGQGIAGHVAATGKPLLISDVSKDPRWYKHISESLGVATHSIACVPMKLNGKTIGVVQIIDKIDGGALLKSDLKILKEFAGLAAMAIGNAKKIEQVKNENIDLKEELGFKYQLVGKSSAFRTVISDAFKIANSKSSALILGESGTGKELLARLIHGAGPRRDKPLVILNCAALPETLLEDELFGHEKGAFTGAVNRKIGKFELADKGTIFLDEIAEMSPGMQAKLLRVLQEGRFYRLGGNTSIAVDVRIISATNKNLDEEVAAGHFREDLYYRLNVIQIRMPSLRNRMEDIPLLSEYFLDIFKQESGSTYLSISKAAMEKMFLYHWPGNIRELRNVLERAVVMGNGKEIQPQDLAFSVSEPTVSCFQVGVTLEEAINNFKKEFIALTLSHTGGNRSKAAQVLNIQRTYLSRLISKYNLS